MHIDDSSVPDEVRQYVKEEVRRREAEYRRARLLLWKQRASAFCKSLLKWTFLVIVFVLVIVVSIVIGVGPAHAVGGDVTVLMPGKAGVKLPSARVIDPMPRNKRMKAETDRLIADFEKGGHIKVSPLDLMVVDCVLEVGKQASNVACFMQGKFGGRCTLGPSLVPNSQVVSFLGVYYNGCELNGIIPAEHGRNLKK